jgi:hypothetical protein
MKSGYSLLLIEKTFTKRLLKGFDAEKLLPVINACDILSEIAEYTVKEI